jgi:ribonuclease HI
MSGKSSTIFYAVHRGLRTGVFKTWKETQEVTKGFSKPLFRKFFNLQDATEFVANGDGGKTFKPKEKKKTFTGDNGGETKKRKRDDDDEIDWIKVHVDDVFKETRDAESRGVVYVQVYTDGACQNNQNGKIAKAGIGAWWGSDNDPRNFSKPFLLAPITNQRAELKAILKVLKKFDKMEKITEGGLQVILLIWTDSKFSIQCIYDWFPKWTRNGWKTSTGEPVKNQDLLLPITNLINKYPGAIKVRKVKAHKHIIGNEKADKRATAGII